MPRSNETQVTLLALSRTKTDRSSLLTLVRGLSRMLMSTYGNLTFRLDQTVQGGSRRAMHHLTDSERDKYLDGSWRVRIMNCWRPLLHPADERPMAMCDYSTVDTVDLIAADRVSREYTGETFYLQHNENQKWYWISGQTPEEMLLFVNYDSDPHGGPPCRSTNSKLPLLRY